MKKKTNFVLTKNMKLNLAHNFGNYVTIESNKKFLLYSRIENKKLPHIRKIGLLRFNFETTTIGNKTIVFSPFLCTFLSIAITKFGTKRIYTKIILFSKANAQTICKGFWRFMLRQTKLALYINWRAKFVCAEPIIVLIFW